VARPLICPGLRSVRQVLFWAFSPDITSFSKGTCLKSNLPLGFRQICAS